MASSEDQISQLQAAIAAQEALRPTLGDAMVDITVTALRGQLDALLAQDRTADSDQTVVQLNSYIPAELADKMRTTGQIGGERKQVTVLFADLSGFTALSERMDPEDLASLTNEALRDLAEAVYQYEGYIDKFVGDSVMAVFGAPVAHEDDPERALRAALAMRGRLEEFNRRQADRLDRPLTLHIGINTGPVIAGNVGSDLRLSYTVMGDTVNTASRLEDVAQPGQILVSRDTYRLTREAFNFRALEPLSVKGKRKPLAVFELERARLHPGKTRGLQGLSSQLVGRERELELLCALTAKLSSVGGQILSVVGEAGIGKSRLIAEWRSATRDQARWVEGRAFAHTATLAYGPFLDLLRVYAGIRDDDTEAEARARLRNTVGDLFGGDAEAYALLTNLLGMRLSPEEAAVVARFPAQSIRQRLFALFERMFTRLATGGPTVLVIEDMHWADQTTMELVEHLLPLTTRLPLAMVGVFRRRADEAPTKLRATVEAEYADRFTPIVLSPLSEERSVQMVERLLSTSKLAPALRTLILDKAEGNPFFVEEVIRSLIDRGALVRDDDGEGWTATPLMQSVTVPDTLQGLLMNRLDGLPAETKGLVQQAAVIGRIFLYRVLSKIAENTPELDADLSHLEREELIRERTRHPEVEYMFKHALTQEVTYESLLSPRRKELHRKVGTAMEELFAERLAEFNSIVATHFLRGEAWDKAYEYLAKAGDAAAGIFAHPEARVHYGNALEALKHLPDTRENRRRRIDTTVKEASVSFLAYNPERNMAVLREAESLANDLLASEPNQPEDGLRLARVHFWMGRQCYYQNQMREAIGYFRQVLETAQRSGDEELLAIPSSAIGRVMIVQGQFGKAAALLSQAVAPLEKTASWPDWILTVSFLGVSLAARGDYAGGVREGERAIARARETNFPTGIALAQITFAFVRLMGGDFQRMLETAQAGIEVAERANDQVALYVGLGFRAWAESRLGQHGTGLQTMARAKAMGQTLGSRIYLADWFAAAHAEIAHAFGRPEEALALAEEALTASRAVGGAFSEGLALRTRAVVLASMQPPRHEEAEADMAASLRALESGQANLEAARTRVAWARLCHDRQDAAAARDHLQKAEAQFQASGLTQEWERARQTLEHVS